VGYGGSGLGDDDAGLGDDGGGCVNKRLECFFFLPVEGLRGFLRAKKFWRPARRPAAARHFAATLVRL
jgi:hypothetical protein